MSKVDRNQTRQGRVPVASNRAPLVVKGFDQDNYVGRWVSDRDDRISTFLAAGYEFVMKKDVTSAGCLLYTSDAADE